MEAGDHRLILGEVLAAYAESELLSVDDDGIPLWDLERARLLLHVGGRLYASPSEALRSRVDYSFFPRPRPAP